MGGCDHREGKENGPGPELSTATPEAMLMAGIVAASGRRAEELDDVALAEARRRLTPSTTWQRVGVTRPVGLLPGDSFGLTSWSDPGVIPTDAAARLKAAWLTGLAPPDPNVSQYLRLLVDTIDDARRLQTLGSVSGLRVVPIVRSHCNDFRWRWPLRVGVVSPPNADSWISALTGFGLHPHLYEVARIDPANNDQRFDIVLVAADQLPEDLPLKRVLHFAGAVVAVGAGEPAIPLERLLRDYLPNTAIAIPAGDLSWWRTFVSELAHDCPIDAAAIAAHPKALVAGDPNVLDLTAVGHWAIAADEQAGATVLSANIERLEFHHEYQGAFELNQRSRQLAAGGATPEVRRDYAPKMAGAPAGLARHKPVGAPAPALPMPQDRAAPQATPSGEPARERRLVTEFWIGDKPCRKVLPPASAVQLEVKIAIPGKDEVSAEVVFPPLSVPEPSVLLDVSVCSNLWKGEKRQQISLSTLHPAKASTSAAFAFTTGATGSVAQFEIVVFHKNRALQAATLEATVRETALPRERVTLLTHPLSTPAQPDGTRLRST